MAPRKRQRGLMPNFLNINVDEPPVQDFDELNQKLKILPADVDVPSDSETRRSESNVRSDAEEETSQSKIGDYQSKRRRRIVDTPIKLNDNPPLKGSFTLPPLQMYRVLTRPANTIAKKERSIPKKSCEDVSSSCDDTPTEPGCGNGSSVDGASETNSGRSDITKVDVMNDSPLDNKDVQGLSTSEDIKPEKPKRTIVHSFKDLITMDLGIFQTMRPGDHMKQGTSVDIVEPMNGDEGSKCEANVDAVSQESSVDIVEPMNCDEGSKCEANVDAVSQESVDIVEPMNCDEGSKCEANVDAVSQEISEDIVTPMKCDEGSKFEANVDAVSQETGVDNVEPMNCDEGSKCEANADAVSLKKHNKRDVSMMEGFTEEVIKLHLKTLKEGSSQSGTSEMYDPNEEESCQLCGHGKLLYPPEPIYCSSCSQRIKDDAVYYTIGEEELSDVQQHHICSTCYGKCRSQVKLFGTTISKANMHKKNNADNQIPEEWVACESCEKWQHQICGLYNKEKDVDNNSDYFCPKCLLEERKSSNDKGFDDSTNLGAKDLPETILSDFIQRRLLKRLAEERKQTAAATGKSINDVSEAEDLTLRVVFSADKTSVVNKQLVDLLHKENYPSEFPYKSKVILLFQKIDGVDVCIFALLVQEFGSECSLPNKRSTYILYLDSVKYFKPERKTYSGEALRTFVYHEILIGYLEYCKLRGFNTGYIWACPPRKGDDYIMYSHPKTQQTPNTKKLLQWYFSMLDKAVEERVVANVTNLYDRFFVARPESTSNMIAARLPYFEGSFWSSNAEFLIQEIEKEGNDELPKTVKSLSRRKSKGLSHNRTGSLDIDDAKKDLLMQKLDKLVSQYKTDVLVVDLNYSCTRCSKAILSGFRWCHKNCKKSKKCKNFQLCESCYDAEKELPGKDIHAKNGKEKHQLSKVQVKIYSRPSTTEDNDAIQENNLFESKQGFLSFSQKHNYNFDTLRRAKHSSMMILHHLHTSNKDHGSQNSTRLTCGNCQNDVSTIYHCCLVCPDYRVCTGCFNKNTELRQLHLFPPLASAHGKQPGMALGLESLNALSHVNLCPSSATKSCSYLKCKEVKSTLNHQVQCKKTGCMTCDNLRKLMRIHAYHCQDLSCPVPNCRNFKEFLTRKQEDSLRSCTLLRCSDE